MNIKMPDPLEKNAAIQNILSELKPPKSLWRWLLELFRCLGFRVIFGNMLWLSLAAAGGSLCIGLVLATAWPPYILATLFAVAPLSFLLATLLIELTERANGLYDLKMTCKYTARQLAAVHLLAFSGMGAVFCVFLSTQVDKKAPNTFFTALAISLCALLLCGLLALFFIRRLGLRWIHSAALWGVLSVVPVVICRMEWESFLYSLPLWVTAGLAALLLFLYLWEIGKMISKPRPEVFKTC